MFQCVWYVRGLLSGDAKEPSGRLFSLGKGVSGLVFSARNLKEGVIPSNLFNCFVVVVGGGVLVWFGLVFCTVKAGQAARTGREEV